MDIKKKRQGILAIKRIADEINYSLILGLLMGENIWKRVNSEEFYKRIQGFPQKEKRILSFLFLNRKLSKEDTFLCDREIKDLLDLGILEEEGGMFFFPELHLLPVNDLLILCSNRMTEDGNKEELVWVGDDSIFLMNKSLHIENKKVLEIGVGSGIISIALAKKNNKVVSTDINKTAIFVCKINCIINNVEEKIELVEGDLFGDIHSRFDYIVTNPPFLPIKENNKNYYFSNGGNDGLKVIRRIIEKSSDYLEKTGEAIILGGAFGNDRLPFFYEEIKDNIIYNSLSVIFYIFGKKKANFELMHVYEELQMEKQRYSDSLYYYTIIFKIKPDQSGGGKVTYYDCSLSNRDKLKVFE